jgi:hypothetical protein
MLCYTSLTVKHLVDKINPCGGGVRKLQLRYHLKCFDNTLNSKLQGKSDVGLCTE